ncbi:hypothetical protein GALMADRAFT_143961 [Galerina marginata CBS 339.88]|uniref:Uncharacterized protein n=1 Tax=Galerina marginata (strain CBS 339.88) TaxID=685588 RepID=A0A067SU67_GALM3|nr:hypothetical protein GALMADRAFT_143961 [Galerina marginata CBS 339.88]
MPQRGSQTRAGVDLGGEFGVGTLLVMAKIPTSPPTRPFVPPPPPPPPPPPHVRSPVVPPYRNSTPGALTANLLVHPTCSSFPPPAPNVQPPQREGRRPTGGLGGEFGVDAALESDEVNFVDRPRKCCCETYHATEHATKMWSTLMSMQLLEGM